jgi:hypothetical protein
MGAKAGSGATRTAQALTAKIIEALEPDPAGPYRVPDTRTRGLGLRVAVDGGLSTGSKARASGGVLWAVMGTSELNARAKKQTTSPKPAGKDATSSLRKKPTATSTTGVSPSSD